MKVTVTEEERQVQHIFERNSTSTALAPNAACDKCLARELNPWHLCSNQGILPPAYYNSQMSSWRTGLMVMACMITADTETAGHQVSSPTFVFWTCLSFTVTLTRYEINLAAEPIPKEIIKKDCKL